MKRPTYDDLIAEQAAFIGPKQPPQPSKMARSGDPKVVTTAYLQDQFPGLFEKD